MYLEVMQNECFEAVAYVEGINQPTSGLKSYQSKPLVNQNKNKYMEIMFSFVCQNLSARLKCKILDSITSSLKIAAIFSLSLPS